MKLCVWQLFGQQQSRTMSRVSRFVRILDLFFFYVGTTTQLDPRQPHL